MLNAFPLFQLCEVVDQLAAVAEPSYINQEEVPGDRVNKVVEAEVEPPREAD